MSSIKEDDTLTVIVKIRTQKGKQKEFLKKIYQQIDEVVKTIPGFISSNFLASDDEETVFNYAQWENKKAYETFLEKDKHLMAEIFKELTVESESYYPLKVVKVIAL